MIKTLDTNTSSINFMKYLDGTIYYGDPGKGVFKIEGSLVTFLPKSEIFKGNRIFEIIKLANNKLLFITEKEGIYLYENNVFVPFLKLKSLNDAILSSGVMVNANLIAIGSVLQGIIFIDTLGNYKFSLTKKQGLQTNSIIALAVDNNGNLWAGTTNGIEQVLINSPYSIIYPDSELQGAVYAVKVYQDKLFVGTNNGLFYTDWPKESDGYTTSTFKKVANSSGQVWALDILKGDLFMGHNNGAFQIIDNAAIKISNDYVGTWRFVDLPDENKMMTGTYLGFQLYKKSGRLWKFEKIIDGFKESARIITKDKSNNIWVSHPYRGVYKITLKDDFSKIMGKPMDFHLICQIMSPKWKIIFTLMVKLVSIYMIIKKINFILKKDYLISLVPVRIQEDYFRRIPRPYGMLMKMSAVQFWWMIVLSLKMQKNKAPRF